MKSYSNIKTQYPITHPIGSSLVDQCCNATDLHVTSEQPSPLPLLFVTPTEKLGQVTGKKIHAGSVNLFRENIFFPALFLGSHRQVMKT